MKLIQWDCLIELRKLKNESIDLILTDPPYWMDYQSAWRTDRSKWKPKISNDKRPFVWWMQEAANKLKDGWCLISFCRFDSWSDFSRCCELAWLVVKAEIVWDKMTHWTWDLKWAPWFRHEIAIFATKWRFIFHWKRPQSLLQVPRVNPKSMLHPNEKPVKLMELLIEHYCPPNWIVVDPFMWVNPVGIACKNLNREFIGIELDENYFWISQKRMTELF